MQPQVPEGPQYSTAQYPPQPAKRRSKLRVTLWVVAFLATFGVGAAVGSAGGGSGPATASANPAPTVTITTDVPAPAVTVTAAPATPAVAPKPKATVKPKPAKATIADGDQVVVGEDVPAGRYSARSTSTDCYYEIDKHATDTIVDNGGFHTGHLVITLKKGQDFSSDSCGDWTQE